MLLHHQNTFRTSTSKPNRLANMAEPLLGDLITVMDPTTTTFEDKVREHYNKKKDKLTQEIGELEKKSKTDLEIRQELKARQQQIAREAFDAALRDLKITYEDKKVKKPVTYAALINHSNTSVVQRAQSIYDTFVKDYLADVDQAVDRYTREKSVASGQTAAALTAVPKPAERVDLDAANPETARLQAIEDQRAGAMDAARAARSALVPPEQTAYQGRTNAVEALTKPDGGLIDDYDDGLTGPETDYTSFTRSRLNGYLYAADIFSGGGEPGKHAVSEAIKRPYDLFKSISGNRLDMKDLSEGMQLSSYFDQAKQYTTMDEEGVRFDRSLGTMAGLLKFTDDIIKNKEIHDTYHAYLLAEFAKINRDPDLKNNEERQIKFLFELKPFAEFVKANPKWKTDYAKIADRTDPEREEGDMIIDDYPDDGGFNIIGEDRNRHNPVRDGLNGYLYSVFLFKGGNGPSVNDEYRRAFEMYEDVAGDMFEQEALDRPSPGGKGDNDGFGLKQYAIEADAYTTHPSIRYTIAGLLKQTETIQDNTVRATYRSYLEEKFKILKPDDTEEFQMTVLSTVKSPVEAEREFKNILVQQMMHSVIEATKQHNQYQVDPKLVAELQKDPATLTTAFLTTLAKTIKTQMDTFVVTRSDKDLKDLEDRFNILQKNNTNLRNPVYSETEMVALRKRIEDDSRLFAKAKLIVQEGNLDQSVADGYLRQLTLAEKEYYNIVADIDSRTAAAQNQGKDTAPEPKPPVLPIERREEPPVYEDTIHQHWASAEREESAHGDYVGILVAESGSDIDKVQLRSAVGKKVGYLENGEEVKRTAADAQVQARNVEGIVFIQIHWHGKKVWVPETQVFMKSDYDGNHGRGETPPTPPTIPISNPPSRPPEAAPPGPRLAASYLDQVFARATTEVERSAAGTPFEFAYNGKRTACRVLKGFDGYHLNVNHPDTGNTDYVFPSLNAARAFIEYGGLIRDLAIRMIIDKNVWNRYRSSTWLDRVKEIKRTGPFSMFLELDWKRNKPTETGNGKIELNVNPDGSIFYRIRKDYVGPNGEDFREGTVGDQTQLIDAINHAKNWSENYRANKSRNPDFGALENRERLTYAVTDIRTYQNLGNEIGELYYFHNFENYGYAYMTLDWDGNRDLTQRHRSLTNPILEVKLTNQNTLAWKLTNQNGPNSMRVGISATARDFNELARQIASVRGNAKNALSMPAQLLPNLGNSGYSLA